MKKLRVSGNVKKQVKKVAILGGSGEKFITEAYKQNADVLITGDITFNQAQEAIELGIIVLDAGHYIEKIMKSIRVVIDENQYLEKIMKKAENIYLTN